MTCRCGCTALIVLLNSIYTHRHKTNDIFIASLSVTRILVRRISLEVLVMITHSRRTRKNSIRLLNM